MLGGGGDGGLLRGLRVLQVMLRCLVPGQNLLRLGELLNRVRIALAVEGDLAFVQKFLIRVGTLLRRRLGFRVGQQSVALLNGSLQVVLHRRVRRIQLHGFAESGDGGFVVLSRQVVPPALDEPLEVLCPPRLVRLATLFGQETLLCLLGLGQAGYHVEVVGRQLPRLLEGLHRVGVFLGVEGGIAACDQLFDGIGIRLGLLVCCGQGQPRRPDLLNAGKHGIGPVKLPGSLELGLGHVEVLGRQRLLGGLQGELVLLLVLYRLRLGGLAAFALGEQLAFHIVLFLLRLGERLGLPLHDDIDVLIDLLVLFRGVGQPLRALESGECGFVLALRQVTLPLFDAGLEGLLVALGLGGADRVELRAHPLSIGGQLLLSLLKLLVAHLPQRGLAFGGQPGILQLSEALRFQAGPCEILIDRHRHRRGIAADRGGREVHRPLEQGDRDTEPLRLQRELRLRDHGVARLEAELELGPAFRVGSPDSHCKGATPR